MIALGGSAALAKGSAQPPKALIVRVRNVLRPRVRRQGGPALAWQGRREELFIEPDSPWENGNCESFNSALRDELLNGEIFATLREAQVLIGNWRRH